jgi:hypothetical protein
MEYRGSFVQLFDTAHNGLYCGTVELPDGREVQFSYLDIDEVKSLIDSEI